MGTHHKSKKETRKRKYTEQFSKTEANKKKKLDKHISKHPNDLVARKAKK